MSEEQSVHNRFVGDSENAVLAGTINGGVHYHGITDPLDSTAPPVYVTLTVAEYASTGGTVVIDDRTPETIPVSGKYTLRMLVEGCSARAVVLTALRPVVLRRQRPRQTRPGFDYRGSLLRRQFDVLLDDDPPRIVPAGEDFPFTVSASDPEQFLLNPHVEREEVEWLLELDWTCAGRTGTMVIDNGGQPLKVYPSALDE